MNKKIISIIAVVLAIIISATVFFTGYQKTRTPQTVYKVYLDGQEIGLINSKDELERYIDQQQNEIKEKYNVEKVYLPNNLKIEKEITYSDNISTVEDIYEKIKDTTPFSIKGYEVKIKGIKLITNEGEETTKSVKIHVLDKELFTNAVETMIKAFIDEEDYLAFRNGTQKDIEDVGSKIENIFIQNDITVKETNISVEENIFTDIDELSQYLLFGTLESQKEYAVRKGDTVEDIAFNNKMSTNEFLVANPTITSADDLLYVGQKVNIGILDPALNVGEEEYVVEYQTVDYNVVYEYDSTMIKGKEKVKQKGVDGRAKVSYILHKSNGEIIETEPLSTETIIEAKNKIVVKGTKVVSDVGVSVGGVWHFPITKPYRVTSPYGYRWGKLHTGTDMVSISNSRNIFAVNNGKVVESKYNSYNGNYIIINHKNGWYSTYAHLSKRYVEEGDVVEMGQVIGLMGETGNAHGVHLHFSLWKGYPFVGGTSYNAMRVLKFK